MGFPAPSKLYFLAAALSLVVVALGLSHGGLEPRAFIGFLMASGLVVLGLRARTGRGA